MVKILKKLTMIIFIVLVCVLTFVGCSSDEQAKTPAEIIAEHYGNKEFKISFNSENLIAPIEDIYYTANKMPTLPVPEKTGYIFEGWYYDAEFTVPYEDGSLYLYMRDVTLYPKWVKEEMEQNGVYDIEIECNILEDTIKKGQLTDQYGYYKFNELIDIENTYIEKTDDVTLLKIQYITPVTTPFGYDSAVLVSVSSQMGSTVYIQDKIDSASETTKTVFLNINDLDIADTIYLDITSTYWDNSIDALDAQKTTTKYTVEFKIKKFIGFSRAFVDTSAPLEDGYYLIKSFYRQESNIATMMDSYNPVYSYIIAENGNYKLVKPYYPYSGMVGVGGDTTANNILNYYDRGMTFSPIQLFFSINAPKSMGNDSNEKVDSKWYPGEYNAGSYGEYTYEFHSDTGKFYAIFDLGSDLTKDIMINGAATGFMETYGAMGRINLMLCPDYEHMIKVASIDYTPLMGDAYTYADEMQYYPGSRGDLNEKNMLYDAMISNGSISMSMVNFYFSANSLNEPNYTRTMYSSKMVISPINQEQSIANSRYEIAYFDVTSYIYGYDGDSNLYADVMTVNSFDGAGLRENIQIKNGMSCKEGEIIRLKDLYVDKVNAIGNYDNVEIAAYLLENGKPNYSKPITLTESFAFEKDIAIIFTYKTGNGMEKSIVELVKESSPTFSIVDTDNNRYDPSATYTIGDDVMIPILRYEWMGVSGGFIDNYYDSENNQMGVNPMKFAYVKEENSLYTVYTIGKENLSVKMNAEHMIFVWEVTNVYGEHEHYMIDLYSEKQPIYEIVSENTGETIASGNITYDADGKRNQIVVTKDLFLTDSNYNDLMDDSYSLKMFGETHRFVLSSYDIYTSNSSVKVDVSPTESLQDIYNKIRDEIKNSDYASIYLTYRYGEEEYNKHFIYNMTISGSKTPTLMNFKAYFTGYSYYVDYVKLFGINGAKLSDEATITVQAYKDGELLSNNASKGMFTVENADGRAKIIFNTPGKYVITYKCTMRLLEDGTYVFENGQSTFTYSQEIEVLDGKGYVYITYVTDEEHKFKENGATEYTVAWKLSDIITALSSKDFHNPTNDTLFGFVTREYYTAKYNNGVYGGGRKIDFVSSFNAQHITLYAIWDSGAYVVADYDEAITGQSPSNPKKWYINANGNYSVNLADQQFEVQNIPSGYKHIGWRIGDEVYTLEDIAAYSWRTVSGDCTIYAVFVREYKVTYIIDQTMSTSYILSHVVLEGETLPEQEVNCKVEGYEFKYWVIEGTTIPFDMNTPITSNTRLVAVFGEIED